MWLTVAFSPPLILMNLNSCPQCTGHKYYCDSVRTPSRTAICWFSNLKYSYSLTLTSQHVSGQLWPKNSKKRARICQSYRRVFKVLGLVSSFHLLMDFCPNHRCSQMMKAKKLSKLLFIFAEAGVVRQLQEMRLKVRDMMDALSVTPEGQDKMSECTFSYLGWVYALLELLI